MKESRWAFSIDIYKGEDGFYVASCREIPGCVTQGKTLKEVRENMLEALSAALETLAQRDAPLRVLPDLGRIVKTSKVELTIPGWSPFTITDAILTA